jgi:hypothetical protein
VLTNPPTIFDFLSYAARGKKPPRSASPELLEMWTGISAYDDLQVARTWAVARPYLGSFIATLGIEDGAPVRIRQTGQDRTHYDLWGDAEEMLSRVIAIERV